MASDDDSGRGPVTTDTPVGVIGLGAIGDGVASALERAGFPVVVCDVREEATQRHEGAARVASSPAELAGQVDAIVVAVVDDAQVHSVLSGPAGALAAARPGTVVVVVSTITMACVEALGEEAAGYGVVMVDCGVSGGPAAAAAGELVCMVGGDRTVIDAMAPVFDALGSMTVVMGPFGTGLAAKLARNLVQYGGWLAAYEGQKLAEASGVNLARLAQVIRASDAKIGGAATLMFRPTVAPFGEGDDQGLIDAMASAAALAHKDLRAALDLAAGLDLPLPLAAMTDRRADAIFGVAADPDAPERGSGESEMNGDAR